MIIYLTNFFIFSCAMQILFTESAKFSSLDASMWTMFSYGLGEFDFDDFKDIKNLSP